jgi:predicted metal-binding protein
MTVDIEGSFDIEASGMKIKLEILGEFVSMDKLKINKVFFEKMCKVGCDKYGKHYGCPPVSQSFDDYTDRAKNFLALMFCAYPKQNSKINFGEIEQIVYPEIDGLLRKLEKAAGAKHIAARSCKLCEPCKREKNLPCKNPEQRRNCTVSLGIDCRDISENIFHKPLVWQKGDNLNGYTSFICLVPMKGLEKKEEIMRILKDNCRSDIK